MMGFKRGASAVEFVLCMPVALIMITGSIDFALWGLTRQAVSRAVQDGARQASVLTLAEGEPYDALETYSTTAVTEALATWGLSSKGMLVGASWQADNSGVWWLTVDASVPYESILPIYSAMNRPVTRQFVVYTQEQPPPP
ncbi:MAG: TadE family protein [Myxococcota bacterium]